MRGVWLCLLGLGISLLQGCGNWLPASRYGPDPVLEPKLVDASLANQINVLQTISYRYHIQEYYSPTDPVFFTQVTFAGFNYVDEACTVYLENLFILDRRRNRVKEIIAATSTAATAVLVGAKVSTETILYLSTALGFSSNVAGIVSQSYLYEMKPSLIFGIVKELQDAYRLAAADAKINSRAAAVYWLRGYLSLCFPMTIEAKVDKTLAAAKATAAKPVDAGKTVLAPTALISQPVRAIVPATTTPNIDLITR